MLLQLDLCGDCERYRDGNDNEHQNSNRGSRPSTFDEWQTDPQVWVRGHACHFKSDLTTAGRWS